MFWCFKKYNYLFFAISFKSTIRAPSNCQIQEFENIYIKLEHLNPNMYAQIVSVT